MSLPTNNKKGGIQNNSNQKNPAKGSKFIKGAGSKQVTITKKVRSTGANRGS